MKSKGQEYWKKYFESANCSIYQIIHNAIRLAAVKDIKDFRLHRGQIVEKLYSCKLSTCCCDDNQSGLDAQNTITAIFRGCKNRCAKNKLVAGNSDDSVSNGPIIIPDEISKDSISEAEVEKLTDEIDNERENIHQVLEIKEMLENSEDQVTELFVSLRKLQLIVFSVEVLEVTKIGTTVNDLQQHWSRQIRELAKCILDCWKTMIEEWIDSNADLAEGSKDPNPLPDDECGLPTPPIDEGLLFVSHPGVRLSEFFDDLDENGNPEKCNEINEFLENQTNPPTENRRELKLQVTHCPASMSGDWRQKAKRDCVEKLLRSKYYTPPDNGNESEKIDGKNDQTKIPTENKRKLELQLIQCSASISTKKGYESEKIDEKNDQKNTPIENKRKLKLQLIQSSASISTKKGYESEKIDEKNDQTNTPTENKRKLELQLIQSSASIITKKGYESEKIDEKNDQTNTPTENKRKLKLQLIQSSASLRTSKRHKARHESTEKLATPANARPSDHRNSSQRIRKPKVNQEVDNERETHKKKDKHKVQQSPNSRPKDSRVRLDAAATEVKSETSKRRLREGYEEHERTCRKNRTTHFNRERYDRPKHGFTHRRTRSKSHRDRSEKYH